MASTMKTLPRAFTAWAISSMGLTMPEVVSQWMTQTWLMAGSASSAAATSSAVGAALSPLSILTTGRPMLVEDLRRAVAIGAIGDDQRLASPVGQKAPSAASMAKVPEPCMMTHS